MVIKLDAIDILAIQPKDIGWFREKKIVTPWKVIAQICRGERRGLSGGLLVMVRVVVGIIEHRAITSDNVDWRS